LIDEMEITTRTVGKCKVLDCTGKLTLGHATAALRNMVRKAVKKGALKIILNLKDVPYFDSSGIGEIINSQLYAKNYGSKLVFLNATKKFQRIMELTKTGIIFEYFYDEQKALEGCEHSGAQPIKEKQ
jgi:anti-anti-sigma factor